MRVGISIASSYPAENVRDGAAWMIARAKAAAEAGLDSLFFGDHHVTATPYYQNTPILARALADWRDAPAGEQTEALASIGRLPEVKKMLG